MKTIFLLPMLLGATFISTAWGNSSDLPLNASAVEQTQTMTAPNASLKQITYTGSDPLSVDDPLGNHPVSVKDDMGPPQTQGMGNDSNCVATCARAERRWSSPTNWRQDRAMGLSVGWGGSGK